ncbi:MAG: flagellar export chaperone FliS [Spirochaetaceae bacterium]|jgi:flagellar protein FliS|nr:flagellar export chaperone FliS [Spirochaetaceae bacterium]
MGYSQAFAAYRETGVKTAGKGRLIVMLYDGAIKELTSAAGKINDEGKVDIRELDKFNASCLKAQEIITELMVSLDMEAGGEIAGNLMALYIFFNQELVQANIHRDKKRISAVLDMMSSLRDSWAVAANSSTAMEPSPVRNSVDING